MGIDLTDPVAIKSPTGSKVFPAAPRPPDDHPLRKVRRPLSVVSPLLTGPDVYALQEAENALFERWGLHDHVSLDGEFGPLTARATNHVGFLLGLEPQGEDPHWIGKLFTQDEQRFIRDPSTRSDAQRQRSENRVKEAHDHQQQNDAHTPTGIRAKVVEYCQWGVAHAGDIHYSQVRPMDLLNDLLHLPVYDDCSEFTTKAAKYAGAPDPNGMSPPYNGGGFTGTMFGHLPHIMSSAAKVGDLVEWGGYPGSHVVIYAGGGMCWSHGQEAGPLYISISAEINAHAGQSTNYLKLIDD